MALVMTNPKGIEVPWPPPQGGCPPWCDISETHERGEHPDDRNHFTIERMVPLTLEPADELFDGSGEPRWEPHTLEVYLRQRWNEDTPVILLAEREETGVKLTVREARELVEILLAAIESAQVRS